MKEKKRFLLRMDEEVYRALERWAADELRSVNAQIEFILADALKRNGRTPKKRAPTNGENHSEDKDGRDPDEP